MALTPLLSGCGDVANGVRLIHPLFCCVWQSGVPWKYPSGQEKAARDVRMELLCWWLAENPRPSRLPVEYFKV